MGISEIKRAIEALSPAEKIELLHWFAGLGDVRTHHVNELHENITIGIAQRKTANSPH
jgi:hypothetical protein